MGHPRARLRPRSSIRLPTARAAADPAGHPRPGSRRGGRIPLSDGWPTGCCGTTPTPSAHSRNSRTPWR